LARPEIVTLKAYAHAAWLPSLTRLHANEAPWRPSGDTTAAGLNRYPEPQPQALIARLAALYGVPAGMLLVGRGSDEAIDLLSRIYLRAGTDAILQSPPTFGMYRVAAHIQGAGVVDVPLERERGWSLDPGRLLAAWRPSMKIFYLCSPCCARSRRRTRSPGRASARSSPVPSSSKWRGGSSRLTRSPSPPSKRR